MVPSIVTYRDDATATASAALLTTASIARVSVKHIGEERAAVRDFAACGSQQRQFLLIVVVCRGGGE